MYVYIFFLELIFICLFFKINGVYEEFIRIFILCEKCVFFYCICKEKCLVNIL